MKKKQSPKPSPRKVKTGNKPITTTSVAFKSDILDGIKKHPLHENNSLSVSWIINALGAKFLAGEVTIEYP